MSNIERDNFLQTKLEKFIIAELSQAFTLTQKTSIFISNPKIQM